MLSVLIIAKDFLGNAYLPLFNFNGIGDYVPGGAYQCKIHHHLHLAKWPISGIISDIRSGEYSTKSDFEKRFPLLNPDNKALEHDLAGYISAMDNVRIDLPTGWSFIGYNRIHGPIDRSGQGKVKKG
mgnify:FL=1